MRLRQDLTNSSTMITQANMLLYISSHAIRHRLLNLLSQIYSFTDLLFYKEKEDENY